MLLLYRSAFAALLPWIGLRLFWKGRRDRRYWYHIPERLGFYGTDASTVSLWVHAASVGEVQAASTIIDRYLALDPEATCFITTMTPTGRQQIAQRYGNHPQVQYGYVPYDMRSAVRRLLHVIKPSICVIMETELWPVLITETARQRVPLLLANARLSRRSCRKYAYVRAFAGSILQAFSVIAAQYSADARRFRFLLGADHSTVHVMGSVKYDLSCSIATQVQSQPRIWLAVSTHPGEETLVLLAFATIRARYPDSLLLLAPRHVERVPALISQCKEAVGEAVYTYSEQPDWQTVRGVVLIDQLGILSSCYAIASVALVGGSLVERGGQNPIEPASYGLPVLMGPSRYNFHTITRAMRQAGICTTVTSSADIAAAIIAYRDDPQAVQAVGEQAKRFVAAHGGAADKHVASIRQLMRES